MSILQRKTFIVGMPRAGTTYLSKLLNNHSQIMSSGETLFFGRLYLEPDENGYYTKDQIDYWLNKFKTMSLDNLSAANRKVLNHNIDIEFSKLETLCTPKDLFESLTRAFKNLTNKPFFIEKTPHHIQYLGRILHFYPDAKFIVLIRDPYKWLLSYKFQGSQKSAEIRNVFKKIYHPIFASLVWKKNFISVQTALEKYQHKCIVVQNENLNDNDTSAKLQSFINIDYEDIAVEKVNSSFTKIEKPELSNIDLFWMNFIAKKYILKSPYSLVKSKTNFIEILVSIFKIIPSGFAVLKYLPSNSNIFAYLFRYLKK